MKMELLAPAGDFESLKTAVYNGANAVYLGIKQFNARNNIDGFDLNNLADAVNFAHLYQVKVYLALNILIKDDEMNDALNIVCKANNIGVDAFIIQDLGLAGLIRKHYPSIILHASTQMGVHNLEGVKILEKLGFKRVVLSRETPLDEIKRIHDNSDIEIEFFVQGALCVSFSGNCYICSHLAGKSGNRGVCQQFCRLPYRFESDNITKQGFLLSAKDICLIDYLKKLKEVGVLSLKIEGRARRPFYVAQACKVYRKALDGELVTDEEFTKLKIAFNRELTPAYFNGNGNIISKIQGNNGVEIGEVVDFKMGKKFNEVFIKTDYNLQSKSGLKFLYKNKEIASIGSYDIKKYGKLYRVTTKAKIKVGSKVNIIQDNSIEEEILKYKTKLPINVKFVAIKNKPLILIVSWNDERVEIKGEDVLQAKTLVNKVEDVKRQLERSQVFQINESEIILKDCYLLNSSINQIRNEAYNTLQEKILKKYEKIKLNAINIEKIGKKYNKNKFNFKIIEDMQYLEKCDNLIYDYNDFSMEDIKLFDDFCKQNKCDGYLDLPNFATEQDILKITKVLNETNLGIVANNLYAFKFNCKKIGGQFLNIYNSYTIQQLLELDKMQACFVEEIDREDLNLSVPLLKRENVYMTLLHCPFKQNLGGDCNNCKYNKASYTMSNGRKFNIKRKKTYNCVFLLKD